MSASLAAVDVLDRWLSRRVASNGDAAADRFADLAAWANGVPIWGTAAGLLAITGHRGRRAAIQAVGAYGLASASSNLVAKRLVHRPRPLTLHRRGRSKASSALPSSHAATGAAFSVAVLWEWPMAGLPLTALAGAVAASRVKARQHQVGDVVVGFALGALIGTAVHHLGSVRRGSVVRASSDDGEQASAAARSPDHATGGDGSGP